MMVGIKSKTNDVQHDLGLSDEQRIVLFKLIELEKLGLIEGRYADIPEAVYHHPLCPGFSSTRVKTVASRSINHFININKSSKALRFGSAFHCFAHEPARFRSTYKIGENLELKDFNQIKAMKEKIFSHPDLKDLYDGAVFEMTFFARCRETGVLMKCRADGYNERLGVVFDLKSCMDASPSAFAKDARKYHYRISAAYYLNVISIVMRKHHRNFLLVACEKEEPFEVTVYRVDDRSLSQADEEIQTALTKLANPSAWPGYDLGVKDLWI